MDFTNMDATDKIKLYSILYDFTYVTVRWIRHVGVLSCFVRVTRDKRCDRESRDIKDIAVLEETVL